MTGEAIIPRLDPTEAERWLRRDVYAVGAPDTIRRILFGRYIELSDAFALGGIRWEDGEGLHALIGVHNCQGLIR